MSEQPYRERAQRLDEADSYASAWADYQWRTRVLVGLFVLFLPTGLFALNVLGPRAGVVLLPYGGVCMFAALFAAVFKCPHCHGRFNPRRNRPDICRQCGIRIGTAKSAEDSPLP